MFADGSSESLFYIISYRLNIFQQNPINKFKGMLADCSFEKAKNTKWTFKKIPLKISKALLKVGTISYHIKQDITKNPIEHFKGMLFWKWVNCLAVKCKMHDFKASKTNPMKSAGAQSQIYIQQISWKL